MGRGVLASDIVQGGCDFYLYVQTLNILGNKRKPSISLDFSSAL